MLQILLVILSVFQEENICSNLSYNDCLQSSVCKFNCTENQNNCQSIEEPSTSNCEKIDCTFNEAKNICELENIRTSALNDPKQQIEEALLRDITNEDNKELESKTDQVEQDTIVFPIYLSDLEEEVLLESSEIPKINSSTMAAILLLSQLIFN